MKNIWKYILIGIPVLLVIAVLVFYLLKLPTQEKQSKYLGLVAQGNAQLEQMEYAKALNSYNEAASMLDSKGEAYEGIAKVLVDKHQLGQLVEVLDKSTSKLNGEDKSKLYTLLAQGYYDIQNPSQAQTYFEKAVDFSYQNELAKLGLAKSLLNQGNYERAKNYLDIPTNSVNYEQAYIHKLVCAYNKPEDLKKVLEETITIGDATNKKYYDDFKAVTKVGSTETMYTDALLSKIYVNMGYNQLAIKLYEAQTDQNIGLYSDFVYIAAVANYNEGKYDKTVEILKDYVNTNADPNVYLLQARSNIKIDQDTTAIKNYDSAVVASGDKSEDVYNEYIEYLLENAQYAKAKEVLDRADKKYNENWIDIFYLRMYFETKNNAKAQTYMDKLSKSTNLTDSEKRDMYFWTISQLLETQKTSDATIQLAKYKELDKYNPKYYLLAGKLHLQTANTNDAKTELEQAIDLDLTGEVTESAKKLLSRVN